MYEIWLVLNIVWEIALGIWPLLAGAAAIWVVIAAMAWRHAQADWRAALPGSLLLGAIAGAAAFLVVPSLVGSSLGAMGYWVDWGNLLAIACGAAVVAFTYAWPLLAMRSRPPSPGVS
ncbi:MAG: hypothetical protein HS128_01750 [Ideonella sp.]|nr:hypothetical protein [Ideonella sp.]MCC7459517.1 hypothetical protein [Nitrospira sp.]